MVQKVHQEKVSEFIIYISKHIEPLRAANIAKKKAQRSWEASALLNDYNNQRPNCDKRVPTFRQAVAYAFFNIFLNTSNKSTTFEKASQMLRMYRYE